MRKNRLLAILMGLFLLIASLGCSLVSTTPATTTTTTSASTTPTTTTTLTTATTETTTTTAPRNVRIELLATPTKLVYEFGEPFDPTGIQVAVVLSDGTSIPLSADVLEFIAYEPEQPGLQTVFVRYDRFTKSFNVYVKEEPQDVPNVTLSLVPPNKTVYQQNEPIDWTGLVVSLRGIENTVVYLTEGQFAVTGADTSSLGTKTVVISVLGLEASFTILVESAIPTLTGYYADASGLDGSELLLALRTILNDGLVRKTYGDARYILNVTDRDPTNPANVILVYLGTSVSGTWDGGVTWNREHVWPQSRMGCSADNTSRDLCADLHNLKPANPSINSSRGNKFFGLTTTATTFAPREQVRGDLARILFYMAVTYPGLTLSDNNADDTIPEMGLLTLLLLWHVEDPVDAFEQNRNEIIYEEQGNRNPFIDHPHLVDLIW
jgi:endonuclease I